MFEVGFSELLLIMALALIVLGPEKLPKVASHVGRWMGRARAMARQFRETLEEEVQLEPTILRPGTASSGSSSAGAAASSPASEPVATSAAAAGGLAASATNDYPPLSNIPYSDSGYSAASGDDADTRHNEYDGAAYTPPDAPADASPEASQAPLTSSADVGVHGGPGVADPVTDFDPNFDPTAPVADPHGQRGA